LLKKSYALLHYLLQVIYSQKHGILTQFLTAKLLGNIVLFIMMEKLPVKQILIFNSYLWIFLQT